MAALEALANGGAWARARGGPRSERRGQAGAAVHRTGQPARGMGAALHATLRCFARRSTRCGRAFDVELERPLRDVMFAEGAAGRALHDQTAYAQPALFALEVALFRMLRAWGVKADYVVGTRWGDRGGARVGGVVAGGCVRAGGGARAADAGAAAGGGAMVSIEASEEEVRRSSGGMGPMDVASPQRSAVDGGGAATRRRCWRLDAHFEAQGRRARLRVSHAFHSPHMEGMLEAFGRGGEAGFAAAAIPLVSNVTGELASAEELARARRMGAARAAGGALRSTECGRWSGARSDDLRRAWSAGRALGPGAGGVVGRGARAREVVVCVVQGA